MLFPLRDDNPRQTFPLVTIGIIIVNTLVFFYQLTMSPERGALFIRAAGVIPLEITTLTDIVRFPDQPRNIVPVPLTIFTSMFVHGGWLHLISNMWYLWIFGDNIEDSMGHFRFILFYLIAGLFAALAQIFIHPTSLVPMVGASGAIAGILGAYLIQYPRARVRCLLFIFIFFTFVDIPAFAVLGFWFIVQLLRGMTVESMADVAWFAHIGGFLAGVLLIKFFIHRRHIRRKNGFDDLH